MTNSCGDPGHMECTAITRQENIMRNLRLLAACALTMSCLVTAGAAEESPTLDDLVREFAQRIPAGTVSNVRVLDMNVFHVESNRYKELGAGLQPDGKEFNSVVVSAPGAFRVAVSKGVPPTVRNGVDIFLANSGKSLLTLVDSDGDGRPDVLSYYAVDAAGNDTSQVIDYDMDGQPDYKIDFVHHRVELWHAGRWYTVEKRNGRRGIVLGGDFIVLEQKNSGSFTRYFVP